MHRLFSVVIGMLLFSGATAHADGRVFGFGVPSQRNINLTAEYWNPISKYVGDKAGITLQLRMTKTAQENSAAIGRGEFDVGYSNPVFSSTNAPLGYRVLAHPIPVFAGNQEGAVGQLKAGRVMAASMNSPIMREYGLRENLKYRVL